MAIEIGKWALIGYVLGFLASVAVDFGIWRALDLSQSAALWGPLGGLIGGIWTFWERRADGA